jgi:hypothetical protein
MGVTCNMRCKVGNKLTVQPEIFKETVHLEELSVDGMIKLERIHIVRIRDTNRLWVQLNNKPFRNVVR